MDEWLERHRWLILGILFTLLCAVVVVVWISRPKPEPIVISTPTPTVLATPAPLRVYVTGAVKQPDVYALAQGSIVKDAISAAGGTTEDADLDRINLAQELNDQMHVHVPCVGEETTPVAPSGTGGGSDDAPDARININTASAKQLESLPGIGPTMATRIVEYRTAHGPFTRPEDIVDVNGIGPTTYEKLKDRITVE